MESLPQCHILSILGACTYSPAMECRFVTIGGHEEDMCDFETTLETLKLNTLFYCGNAAWLNALLDEEVASFAVYRGGPSSEEIHVAFKSVSEKYEMRAMMRASKQKRQAAEFRWLYGFCEDSLRDKDFRLVGGICHETWICRLGLRSQLSTLNGSFRMKLLQMIREPCVASKQTRTSKVGTRHSVPIYNKQINFSSQSIGL
jgi:hypothetical protein